MSLSLLAGVLSAVYGFALEVAAPVADLAEQRSIQGPFRVPVDRVFTMTGFGTVVKLTDPGTHHTIAVTIVGADPTTVNVTYASK